MAPIHFHYIEKSNQNSLQKFIFLIYNTQSQFTFLIFDTVN